MNNLFHPAYSLKKLRLFAVIVAAVALVISCKKPTNGIGESLQPEDDLMGAFQTDTTTLTARTLRVDSVRSDFYSNVMIGNYVDDKFGVVRTTGVLQFIPSTSRPRYAENIRIDSVVLSLVYQNATYGKNVPMYFNVREVLDELVYENSYYTNSKINTSPQNLVKPGLEILDPNPESAGTSSTSTPALRIHLKHSLGTKLLTADTSVLDDNALFKAFFGGLAIGSETPDGQVINYIQSDAATRLTVYYAELDEPEEVLNSTDFIVARTSCKAFTQIDNNYFGTAIQNLESNQGVNGSEYCYLQSGGGTRVAIDISSTNWLKQYNGVTINRAELIIPYDKSEKYSAIGTVLVVYKEDGNDYFTETQTGGNVNVSTGLYRINITNHIQNYISGTITADEIYIQPVYTLSQFANSWSVARSLLHGPGFNSSAPEQNMRLIITYSY